MVQKGIQTNNVAKTAASLLLLFFILWRFIMFPNSTFANIALAAILSFIGANFFLQGNKCFAVRLLRIVWFSISVILILIWGLLETGRL